MRNLDGKLLESKVRIESCAEEGSIHLCLISHQNSLMVKYDTHTHTHTHTPKYIYIYTRISGIYGPFILDPTEGCWVGLLPITWAFGPITIQSIDDLGRLQGRYPENLMLISQLEVRQEEGVKKRGTWRTLRVPDWRHGGHGHS